MLVSGDKKRIAGYYTLSAEHIRADDLPPDVVKTFDFPRYPAFGATLIGRLARDLTFRGQGVGDLLLTDALKVALAISRKIASAAVLVDAKNPKARAFYTEFGFMTFPIRRDVLCQWLLLSSCSVSNPATHHLQMTKNRHSKPGIPCLPSGAFPRKPLRPNDGGV